MPRKRMIHPDLWADEEVGRLTRDARLLWIAMFSLADDEGRGSASVPYLRRAVFGFDDDVTAERVAALRQEIATAMRGVHFYEADGRELYALLNWSRFQKVQHPTPSVFPAPPTATIGSTASTKDGSATTKDCTASTKPLLVENSIDQSSRVEEKQTATAASAPIDEAFGLIWTLYESEHLANPMSAIQREDIGEMVTLCRDVAIHREAIKRARRSNTRPSLGLIRKIVSDYLQSGSWEKPGGKGHGPPGKPPPAPDKAVAETLARFEKSGVLERIA